ncbi:VRR-NUC domain-containing protein [Micrococcus sp. NPDC078436]|uniref:VRR-NUC domain-containing protein n=1 Tax=Micrococcus sp. NPDC078436 TaxID=3154960 RepID=UPI00344E7A11
MRQEEYVRMMAAAMSERDLQDAVVRMAESLGWKVYHTYDSRRSGPGWPDLVLGRDGRVLFRELKTMKGRVSKDQQEWIGLLAAAGDDVAVWRPDQWHDRTIERELAG